LLNERSEFSKPYVLRSSAQRSEAGLVRVETALLR